LNYSNDKILIIDLGSYSIKAGQACKNKPQIAMRSLIGESNERHKVIYGEDALEEPFTPKSLIEYKWDIIQLRREDMVPLFHTVFEEKLKISRNDLGSYSLIFLNGVLQPTEQIKRWYELFLYDFNFEKVAVIEVTEPVFFHAKTDIGLVVDIGFKSTRFVPYYMGYKMSHAVLSELLGGREVEKYRDIKILIEPHRLHRKLIPHPLSELIIKTIEYWDKDLQQDLFSNIILTGWNAANVNLPKKLKKDIETRRPNTLFDIFPASNEYYNWFCASQITQKAQDETGLIHFVSQKDFEGNPNIIYLPRIVKDSFQNF
jgi:actin-related protein